MPSHTQTNSTLPRQTPDTSDSRNGTGLQESEYAQSQQSLEFRDPFPGDIAKKRVRGERGRLALRRFFRKARKCISHLRRNPTRLACVLAVTALKHTHDSARTANICNF